MKRLILASKSPRRIELIRTLGVPYNVQSADIDEAFSQNMSPVENVQSVAQKKAKAVFDSLIGTEDFVVLGVDTIVVCEGQILTKPVNESHAYEMMKLLSGQTHEVHSGVSLISKEQSVTFCETSLVRFIELTDEEINAYIATQEPYDKAGGYGIQGTAGLFIESIEGCYYNIMGLPISRLYQVLKDQYGFTFKWK